MKKKYVLFIALAAIVVFSNSALAHGRHGGWGGGRGYDDGYGYGYGGGGGPCGPGYHHGRGGPRMGPGTWQQGISPRVPLEIPQNIRDKMNEERKLMADMHSEMYAESPNNAKIRQQYSQASKLRQEIADWFFNQRLDEFMKARTERQVSPKN